MPGLRTSLFLGALVVTALAPPAHGQSGNGLYEPFPEANSRERAEHFVDGLRTARGSGLDLSRAELEGGVLVDNGTGRKQPAPALDLAASRRAAGGSGLGAVIPWAAALALLALLAAALARTPALTTRRT
jgi:hypothetical protein